LRTESFSAPRFAGGPKAGGMGRGVPPPLQTPTQNSQIKINY